MKKRRKTADLREGLLTSADPDLGPLFSYFWNETAGAETAGLSPAAAPGPVSCCPGHASTSWVCAQAVKNAKGGVWYAKSVFCLRTHISAVFGVVRRRPQAGGAPVAQRAGYFRVGGRPKVPLLFSCDLRCCSVRLKRPAWCWLACVGPESPSDRGHVIATIAAAVSMHPTLRCHKGIAATTTCAAAACWGVSAMKTRGHSLMPGGMSVGQNGRLDFHITARGTPRWLQCRRHPRPGVRGARRGTLSDSLSRGGCASSSRAHQASPRLAPPHAPRRP